MTPEKGSGVQFLSCAQAEYDEQESYDPNTVYFCYDSRRLFVGDAEYSRNLDYEEVILLASDWKNNSQIVAVNGVTSDERAQLITPVPSALSQADFYNAGIKSTVSGDGILTFVADEVPSEDITVFVAIQKVNKKGR